MKCFHLRVLGLVAALIFACQLFTTPAFAQWSTDPNVNNAISTATGSQYYPTIVSDGAGGAIITWDDYRSGTNYDIYAQRITASGVVQWTANGVAISTAALNQQSSTITSDGAGGAIIIWNDYRSGTNVDIYAQRIDASGVVQWTADGVVISDTADQLIPTIVSDGAGGAIITWYGNRSGTSLDIYAQRINGSGAVQWTANGIAISTALNGQEYPTIVSDGAGGAIITWLDRRSGADIYAQRISASGVVQWTADGVAISTAASNQDSPTITSDGAGGAIITWNDSRSGMNNDIYAQRIDASGVVQWTADGDSICTAASSQYRPTTTSDGAGGAIITWNDERSGIGFNDIYAQRIDASGAVQWTANGVSISTAANGQYSPTIVSDGAGGAIIAWYDYRSGTNYDIYAQRINASGAVQWTANGVAISTALREQYSPTIVSDGAGGAIITWYDYRSGTNHDIYTQQMSANGQLGVVTEVQNDVAALPESFRLEQNYPNPFNPSTKIRFAVVGSRFTSLKVFDILGQEVSTIVNEEMKPGNYEFTWDATGLPGGVYFYRMTSGTVTATKTMILMK